MFSKTGRAVFGGRLGQESHEAVLGTKRVVEGVSDPIRVIDDILTVLVLVYVRDCLLCPSA